MTLEESLFDLCSDTLNILFELGKDKIITQEELEKHIEVKEKFIKEFKHQRENMITE